MKKKSVIHLLILLYLLLICAAGVAAGFGVFDFQPKDKAALAPLTLNGTPIEPLSGDGMEYSPDEERLALSYAKDLRSGGEYLVMVIRGASPTPTDENLVFIDQLTAEDGRISFELFPSVLEEGMKYHVYLSTGAGGSESVEEIAVFRYGAAAEGLALSESEISVPAGGSCTLSAEGASGVTWSSSDESVATVRDGVVTGVKYGSALISATDGKETAECPVRVLFSDVTESAQYYFEPVCWAAENGITMGYDDGSFGVGRNCQRRELMIFLWRFAGCPGKGDAVSAYGDARDMFNDMKNYAPASATNQAIAWASSEGITKGYSDGGFHPTAPIVRKDVMILLYRLAGKPAVSGTLRFPDCQDSPYLPGTDTCSAILWGSQNGITKGYDDGSFGPMLNCLREQIVTFLYRYHNKSM